MIDYKNIDKKVVEGNNYQMKGRSEEACDIWLDAWEDIKSAIIELQIETIKELQSKYRWSEILENYIQDLFYELHNIGISNNEYMQKRIKYSEELLDLIGKQDSLLVENTRRGIAESYYAIGDKNKCDQLFGAWIDESPDWGWGYIGWADCYWDDGSNIIKSEEIIKKALTRKTLQDRTDVLERAISLYKELGNLQESKKLEKELQSLERLNPYNNANQLNSLSSDEILEIKNKKTATQVTIEKVGRNDPCPCGSRKKHKKCCGK